MAIPSHGRGAISGTLRILAPFSYTLEVLRLHRADLCTSPPGLVFSNVRELRLECCDISMAVLERAFPHRGFVSISDAPEGVPFNQEQV